MFKPCDHVSSSLTNKFSTFFGVKAALSCFKQLHLNFKVILELFANASFGQAVTFVT